MTKQEAQTKVNELRSMADKESELNRRHNEGGEGYEMTSKADEYFNFTRTLPENGLFALTDGTVIDASDFAEIKERWNAAVKAIGKDVRRIEQRARIKLSDVKAAKEALEG